MPYTDSGASNDHSFQLRDGRTLGYAEYGFAEGKALFYFNGHPASRLEARFLAESATRAGLRLIGVDRPGMGRSSFKAGRRLLEWPQDMLELADHLHLERFAVVGFSAGAPYALACAHTIPERLTACGIVAGLGPIGRPLYSLVQWLPGVIYPIGGRFFQDVEQARQNLAQVARLWVGADRDCLRRPNIQELLAVSMVEAYRQGPAGVIYDTGLLGGAWGFQLEAIGFSPIYLWHGQRDEAVPIAVGRRIAQKLPHCEAVYYPEEGHISIIANRAPEIVNAFV